METKQNHKNIVAGWIISGLIILFLTFDSIGKLLEIDPVVKGTTELGYAEHSVFPIGFILLVCVLLYIIPKTSFIGALLLTAYMGGAVATHFRIDNPLFTHTLFPVYCSILIWLGLALRNEKLRGLV